MQRIWNSLCSCSIMDMDMVEQKIRELSLNSIWVCYIPLMRKNHLGKGMNLSLLLPAKGWITGQTLVLWLTTCHRKIFCLVNHNSKDTKWLHKRMALNWLAKRNLHNNCWWHIKKIIFHNLPQAPLYLCRCKNVGLYLTLRWQKHNLNYKSPNFILTFIWV